MAATPRVVGIAGSLRPQSTTVVAVDTVLASVIEAGGDGELIDLRTLSLPPYNPDADLPASAQQLQSQVRSADSVILGTPMYHGSYSSTTKLALDYCGFDEFEDTTVGLLAAAGGRFPISALDHLRVVCRALNAWVLPRQVALPQARSVIQDGYVTDEELRGRLELLGEELVRYADLARDERPLAADENPGAT